MLDLNGGNDNDGFIGIADMAYRVNEGCRDLNGKGELGDSDGGQTCRATVRGLEPREPPATLPSGKDLCSPLPPVGWEGEGEFLADGKVALGLA